jgi:hypothetical protein
MFFGSSLQNRAANAAETKTRKKNSNGGFSGVLSLEKDM